MVKVSIPRKKQSVDRIVVIAFEDYECYFKDDESRSLFKVYHWESEDTAIRKKGTLTLEHIIPDRPFYFCDDWTQWSYPKYYKKHKDTNRLYLITISIRKPLILLNQLSSFEEIFDFDSKKRRVNPNDNLVLNLLKKDSVILTPHPYSSGLRQGVLLEPKTSILKIQEIEVPEHLFPYWENQINPPW